MDATVKARWVEVLRSGEYRQGKGALRIGDRFCCLGVLCDLSELTVWEDSGEPDDHGAAVLRYFSDRTYLPPEVMRWAGLGALDPQVTVDGDYEVELSFLNDGSDVRRRSFEEIAALIEEQL